MIRLFSLRPRIRGFVFDLLVLVVLNLILTQPSQAAAPILKVRGDNQYPPYEFEEDGQPTGYNLDVFRAIAVSMGLKADIQVGPWNQLRDDIENGRIDVLAMYRSIERDKQVDFSSPHIQVFHSLFVRNGSKIKSIDDLIDQSVIVQRGDIMHDYLLQHRVAGEIIPVENPVDGLRLLASGRHDAALFAKLQALYTIRTYDLSNLRSVGPAMLPRDYCFAVPEGRQDLLDKLNEGLRIIAATGELDRIRHKWFGNYDNHLTGEEAVRYTLWIGIPFLALLGAILFWSWSLRRQVAERTRDLRIELWERQHAEEALRLSENWLATTLNSVEEAVIATDENGNITFLNRSALQLTGWGLDEANGQKLENVLHILPSDGTAPLSSIAERIMAGEVKDLFPPFATLQDRTGNPHPISLSAAPIVDDRDQTLGAVLACRDISDTLRMEALLRHQQKQEALGTMASGVAHEINNPINVIMNYGELIRQLTNEGSEIDANAVEIITESKRIATIVSNLLVFARQEGVERDAHPLDQTIISTTSLLHQMLEKDRISLDIELPDTLPQTVMQPQQIQQVLVNLLLNARDALNAQYTQDHPDKRILIQARQTTTNGQPVVIVSVTDFGCGIPADIRSRIFDPFFTTKGRNSNPGLGLSISHGIIKDHQGRLLLSSEPGHTVFLIELPAAV